MNPQNRGTCSGAKTKDFLGSNSLRAKTFWTKRAKQFLTTSLQKRAFASHDISKECVVNVLGL